MKNFFSFVFLSLVTICNAQLDSLKRILKTQPNDSIMAATALDIAKESKSMDSVKKYLSIANRYSEENDWLFGKAKSEEIIAINLYRQGLLDSAIYLWDKAATLYGSSKHAKAKSAEAQSYYNIGITQYLLGRFPEAVENNKRALDIRLKLPDKKEILECYNIMSILHISQDEHEIAAPYLMEALDLAFQLNDTAQIAQFHNNLGIVELETKNYDSSIYYFDRSLDFYKEEAEIVEVRMNLGVVYTHKEELEKARLLLLEGVNWYRKSKDIRGKITSLNLLGDLYVITEEWDQLKKVSEESVKLLETLPINTQKQYAFKNLSLALEKLGDTQNALKYFKEYATVKDSLFSEKKLKEIELLEAQFKSEKDKREISELTKKNLSKEVALVKEKNIRFTLIASSSASILLLFIFFLNFKRRKERKQLLLDRKRLEIEQRMLRSQMSPHFIFNALNSIQSYIATNRGYEAEVFLSKFSLLIRKILENSMQPLVTVEEELETLKLYMELEKIRFQNKFDFVINSSVSDEELIPPMLLQPFVENAIIHGMKEIKTDGLICISLSENNDYLDCIIEDNGSGRKRAENSTHKSLATQLINERIQFLEEENMKELSFKIIDLRNESGLPTGTRVELKLPLAS